MLWSEVSFSCCSSARRYSLTVTHPLKGDAKEHAPRTTIALVVDLSRRSWRRQSPPPAPLPSHQKPRGPPKSVHAVGHGADCRAVVFGQENPYLLIP